MEYATKTFIRSGFSALLRLYVNHTLIPQPVSLQATRNTSGVSTLPRKKDEHQSAIENTYSKRLDVAMEMEPASKGDWGQIE